MKLQSQRPTPAQQLAEEKRLIANALSQGRDAIKLLHSLIKPDERQSEDKLDSISEAQEAMDTLETELGNVYARLDDAVVALGRVTAQRAEAYRQRDRALRMLSHQIRQQNGKA